MNNIPPIPPRPSGGGAGGRSPSQPLEKSRLQESINLKMTAKGYYYWDIATYGELGQGMVLKLSELDKYLRKEFPKNVNEIPTE